MKWTKLEIERNNSVKKILFCNMLYNVKGIGSMYN